MMSPFGELESFNLGTQTVSCTCGRLLCVLDADCQGPNPTATQLPNASASLRRHLVMRALIGYIPERK